MPTSELSQQNTHSCALNLPLNLSERRMARARSSQSLAYIKKTGARLHTIARSLLTGPPIAMSRAGATWLRSESSDVFQEIFRWRIKPRRGRRRPPPIRANSRSSRPTQNPRPRRLLRRPRQSNRKKSSHSKPPGSVLLGGFGIRGRAHAQELVRHS